MAESLGQAVLDLRTNLRDYNRDIDGAGKKAQTFDKRLKAVERTAKDLGKSLTAAGKKATLFVTAPIVGLGALAAKLADVQIQAERGLGAALEFAGSAVPLEEFKEFAAELQGITTVGDETSLKMLQVATSMGLQGENAKTAVKEAIGLAAAFGIAETSAIRYTASLADGDTTMLNRYIPTLRNVEDDAERVAKAHEILTGAFGIAVAAAEEGLGPWKQLGNEFGDLLEKFGAIIFEGIKPLIGVLQGLIRWVDGLDDSTKKWIVGLAAAAAAIGPVLIAVGSLLAAFGAIAGAMASGGILAVGASMFIGLLTGPLGIVIAIGLVVAAIGFFLREGGAFENWIAGTTVTLQELVRGVSDLKAAYETIKPDIAAVNQLADEFRGTNSELFAAIREGLVEGKNYDEVVLGLLERFKEGTAEGDALRAKLEEVGSATLAAANAAGVMATEAGEATKSADGFKGTASELERAMWALQNSVAAVAEEFEDLTEVDVDWPNILPPDSAPPLIDSLDRAMERFGVRIPNVARETASLNVLWESGQISGKRMAEIIKRQIAEYERLDVLTPELRKELEGLAKQTGVATGNFGDFFGGIKTNIPVVDKFLGKLKGFLGIFKSIAGMLGSVSKGLGGFFSKIAGGLGGLGGGGGGGGPLGQLAGLFGGGGGGLGGLISGIGGLLGIGGGGAAAAGGTLFLPGIGGISAGVFGAGGATAAGTTAGAAAGTGIVSGITGAIGGGVSAIGGAFASLAATVGPLFTNPFTAIIGGGILAAFALKKILKKADAQEQIENFFGNLRVDKALQKMVDNTNKSLGDLDSSVRVHLGSIIAQMDVSKGELQGLLTTTNQVFSSFDAGALGSAQTTEAFGSAISALVPKMADLGATDEDLLKLGSTFDDLFNRVQLGHFSNAEAAEVYRKVLPLIEGNLSAFGDTGQMVLDTLRGQFEELGVEAVTSSTVIEEKYKAAFAVAEKAAEDAANAVGFQQKVMANLAAEAAKATADKWKEELDRIKGDASSAATFVSSRFKDLRFDVDVGFNVDDLPDFRPGGGPLPEFARGGVVSGPRGQARTVVAHGGETIIPEGGSMGGGTIEIPVTLDGEVLTRTVVKLTPEIKRKLGVP